MATSCVEEAAARLADRVVEFLSREPGKPGRSLVRMEEALFAYNEARIRGKACGTCGTCGGKK